MRYGTTEVYPGPAVDVLCRTKNSRKFLNEIINFRCHGGGGEGHALLTDGMSVALEIFDSLQKGGVRECSVQRYCIIVAMSPPYPGATSLEGNVFCDLTIEQLALEMKQARLFNYFITRITLYYFQMLCSKMHNDLIEVNLKFKILMHKMANYCTPV